MFYAEAQRKRQGPRPPIGPLGEAYRYNMYIGRRGSEHFKTRLIAGLGIAGVVAVLAGLAYERAGSASLRLVCSSSNTLGKTVGESRFASADAPHLEAGVINRANRPVRVGVIHSDQPFARSVNVTPIYPGEHERFMPVLAREGDWVILLVGNNIVAKKRADSSLSSCLSR